MTHRERILQLMVVTALIPFLGLLSGCSNDCTRPDGGGGTEVFAPRTSIENLLHNFLMAYQHRDVAEIDSLLADDFVFHFSEEDQSRPEIPDSWAREMEIAAHGGMFDEIWVQTLALAFAHGDVEIDSVLTTAQDTVWTTNVVNLDLELFGRPRSHPGEPPQLYKVDDGEARFWFRRIGLAVPGGDAAIWEIVAIRETTTSSPLRGKQPHPAESQTWGSIKSLFG